MTGEEVAARAQALVGVRFRAQGRDPKLGLDCLGLAGAAAGIEAEAYPRDYALRGAHLGAMRGGLAALGFVPVAEDTLRTGDLVVMEAAAMQLHAAIFTGPTYVHADARLKKVVESPMPFAWPVLGVWRRGDS
jgi:lipoprotein Spr